MKIVIICDPAHAYDHAIHAAVDRVLLRGRDDQTHGIFVHAPDRDGSQSTFIVFNADEDGCFVHPGDSNPGSNGPSMTVCQLQRHPGAEFEYHS